MRPGTSVVTVSFSRISGPNVYQSTQAVFSEFYNVAPTNALDGYSSSPTSQSPGAITTTSAGDLIYEWSAAIGANTLYRGGFNGSSITPSPGFTLLSADLQAGSADEFAVQSSAGTIAPSLSSSGSATWGSLAIALKSASAGTAPGSGIRIVHVQHTLIGSTTPGSTSAPIPLQFPSSGNLLVGMYEDVNSITSVTDGSANTWILPQSSLISANGMCSQIVYAANANTSTNLSGITLTGLLQLAAFSFRTIKYWSGFAADF